MASHRHSVDPTEHIPTIEGEAKVEGTERETEGRGESVVLEVKHAFNSQ